MGTCTNFHACVAADSANACKRMSACEPLRASVPQLVGETSYQDTMRSIPNSVQHDVVPSRKLVAENGTAAHDNAV
jgi:hypothetical protein